MTKYILLAVIIIALISLVGCVRTTVVVDEQKTYDITSEISSLDIRINAADVVIEYSDKFSVESNLKYLKVTQEDGVLSIVENTKRAKNYNDANLKLYIPENTVFEEVKIATGAGRLTVDSMSADTMKLKSGAGQVQIDRLDVNTKIDIKGGAGEIKILDGTLHNLSLSLGVGELNMTAALRGESDLRFGIGESDLTLIGSKNDYSFDIKQGVGNINIDNNSGSDDGGSTNVQSIVKIKGGVGATDISFK